MDEKLTQEGFETAETEPVKTEAAPPAAPPDEAAPATPEPTPKPAPTPESVPAPPPDLSEELKAEKARADAAEKKAEAAEVKAEVLSLGVKAETVDDVVALAKTRVNEKTTLKQAIEQVLATYPDFKATTQITTGTKTQGDEKGESVRDTIFNAFNFK